MSSFLAEKGIDSPRLHAEILLEHVLECERMASYPQFDRPASAEELLTLRGLVARAAQHEPVAYLTGCAYFFGMRLTVNSAVLIPRPGTETLVEWVLQAEQVTPCFDDVEVGEDVGEGAEVEEEDRVEVKGAGLRILEIGTGSGCIAIALAKHLVGAKIVATDISEAALMVAKLNAEAHGVADRIEFRLGGFYEPIEGGGGVEETFDYVVSNPPYISDIEWVAVAANVSEHEPVSALRAGVEGMDVLGRLIGELDGYLAKPDGVGLFEMSSSQSGVMRECVAGNDNLEGEVEILDDLEGHPRIVVCRGVTNC